MKDDVEEFLRRVAQMRAAAEAQARGQRPAPSQQAAPPQAPPVTARLVPVREEVVYLKPAAPEVVEAEVADVGERVSRRVTDDMRGAAEIAEHTRRLGEEVHSADSKMQAHLHQVFDHRLGQLREMAADDKATSVEQPKGDSAAGDFLKMLRSPNSIRDAIVMAEILRRPEW